jgi:hypothetical protein
MTKTGQWSFSSGQFTGAANRLPFCKLLFNNVNTPTLYNMIGFPAPQIGLASAHLHMAIHGFAFWKFAKPAHEHHLQVCPTPLQACLTAYMTMQCQHYYT